MALISLAAIFILAAAILLMPTEEKKGDLEQKITAITEKNQYIRSLRLNESFQREVKFISREELARLKEENMVYQQLPDKDLYQVDYSLPGKGEYLAVVDLEKEEVVMFYRLAGVKIG